MPAGKQAAILVFPLSPPCLGEWFSPHLLYWFHTTMISQTSVGFLVMC